MQRLFAPGTEWGLPWMPRVLPNIAQICGVEPARTVFTRFIPARRPGEGVGIWRRYYTRWASMTLDEIGAEQAELVPELASFCPPAQTVDKPVYSPWLGSDLRQRLADMNCNTLLITGGETDMCVLSTVLGAADYGFRTIVLSDAVCSVSDESHDAMLALFSERYGQHLETATTDEVLALLER
jgi:nicotinamidase-related amidase